jgi:hypothetical protein
VFLPSLKNAALAFKATLPGKQETAMNKPIDFSRPQAPGKLRTLILKLSYNNTYDNLD